MKDDRVYLIRNLQTWACEPAAERRNQGPPRRPKPPRLGQVLEAVVLLMMRAALVTRGAEAARSDEEAAGCLSITSACQRAA